VRAVSLTAYDATMVELPNTAKWMRVDSYANAPWSVAAIVIMMSEHAMLDRGRGHVLKPFQGRSVVGSDAWSCRSGSGA
jgi:hypothetical protein